MYYVIGITTVWSVHYSKQAAIRNAIRLSAKHPYNFRICRLRHRWSPGDTPAPRYYIAQ